MKHERLWNKHSKFNRFYKICNIFIILNQICSTEFHKKIDLQKLRNPQTVTRHNSKQCYKISENQIFLFLFGFFVVYILKIFTQRMIRCAQTLFVYFLLLKDTFYVSEFKTVQSRMHIVNFWKWCHGFCKNVKNNYCKCRLYAQKLECSTYYRSREVPRDNISFIYLHAAVESKTQIRNYIKIVIFLLCISKTNRHCKYV